MSRLSLSPMDERPRQMPTQFQLVWRVVNVAATETEVVDLCILMYHDLYVFVQKSGSTNDRSCFAITSPEGIAETPFSRAADHALSFKPFEPAFAISRHFVGHQEGRLTTGLVSITKAPATAGCEYNQLVVIHQTSLVSIALFQLPFTPAHRTEYRFFNLSN